jgi:hypothetical protein
MQGPATRIVVVSPDGGFGQTLKTALDAVARVDLALAPGAVDTDPPPALYVIHMGGELARAPGELLLRLGGSCPVIAVMPRFHLAAVVDLMRSVHRVAGIMVAEDLDPYRLSAVAARIVTDDIFGLEKMMAPGTQIHDHVVGDYQDKSRCMSVISEFVEQASVPHTQRAPIEQCIDEMLMNALYDAPVDAKGKPLFSGIAARVRITLRSEQSVAVQYACDGKQFAVSVRDAFGTLDRRTVLDHLHKGLHDEQPIDRKAGGAGMGLYLMAHSSTAVYFHVLPGIATEALCTFDLQAPRRSLQRFAFLVQTDAAGRRKTGPSRRKRAGPRSRVQVVAAAVAAIVFLFGLLLGVVALTRSFRGPPRVIDPRGPASEPGPPRVIDPRGPASEPGTSALATVELDSLPTGAAVVIDGKAMGGTPLTLTSLVPGAVVSIEFQRTGYRAATARLQVPDAGDRKRLVQPLQLSDEFVRVHFVSNPPGAEVRKTGQPQTIDRTYTPADVFVEVNKVQRFTLSMPRHVPLVIEPFTPGRGAQGLEKGGDLAPGNTLRIEATLGGKVTVSGAPHCQDLALPADCTLAPGTYVIEYTGPDGATRRRTVTMAAQDATVIAN